LKSKIWTFQRSNALKNCKETETLLYEMLIYKIGRYIIVAYPSLKYNLSCTFPKGNGIITGLVLDRFSQLVHIERFGLDPKAPTKVWLAITKNRT
jgi:hypothetical protein